MTLKIAALVLAAGSSRRMGRNKLFETFNGCGVLESCLKDASLAAFDSVLIVSGHEHQRVHDCASKFEVPVVFNSQYNLGMSTSIICGLRQLPQDTDFVSVCLADQPALGGLDYARIVSAIRQSDSGKSIFVPRYSEQQGNPVTFSTRYIPEIVESLSGDQGAKFLFKKYPDDVEFIEMPTDAVLKDIDVPDDLVQTAPSRTPEKNLSAMKARR